MENSVSLAVPPMVPTCQILRTTAPSAWTSNSLTGMSSSAFSNCLELMGRDAFLTSYQRGQVLRRVRQVGFHFHARCVAELCFTLRLTTSTSSLSSPSEDLRPGVLLLPVCHLSAGWSGRGAVSAGAGQPPPDWPQEHRCHGSRQRLEQQTGEHTAVKCWMRPKAKVE